MVKSSAAAPRRVTISLGPDALYASDATGRAPNSVRLESAYDGNGWPALANALSSLAAAGTGSLSVVLLPPLAEVRAVDLPPLRTDEMEMFLSRNAARYFMSARSGGAYTVAAARSDKSARVIAAAVPTRLMQSIRAAAEGAGWTIEAIAPAEAAWALAATRAWPTMRRGYGVVTIRHADRTDVLELRAGLLANVRRFRAGDNEADTIARSAGSTNRITDPIAAAASAPIGESALRFRSQQEKEAQAVGARRLAFGMVAAAAFLLIVGAVTEWIGLHRQLDAVRSARSTLAPQLSSAMVGRTSVEVATRQLAVLTAADRSAPRWSAVIAAISDRLPEDASLTAFHARGDSLIIDGLANHAARVFDNLEPMRGVSGLKAAAPVRREIQDDGTAREHFTLAGRVTP